MSTANVMIATPTYDGTVCTSYFNSVSKLYFDKDSSNSTKFTSPYFTYGTLINQARNALVSIMLEKTQYTHILFVDSDMGFEPKAVHQMLAYDKPFTACSCPSRKLDPPRMHAISQRIKDPKLAWLVAQNYVSFGDLISTRTPSGEFTLDIIRGFARTMCIGMGLTLIRRDALETMRANFPALHRPCDAAYKKFGVENSVFQCFESEPDDNGLYVGEDVAFCKRWVQGCGGEIWLNVDAVITHTGPATFTGRLMDRLQYSGPEGC